MKAEDRSNYKCQLKCAALTKFKCFNPHSLAVNSKVEVSPC